MGLAEPITRLTAAREIGGQLGGDDFIVFMRDREVDALLPAPGFAQTLPGARAWQVFLAACVARTESAGDQLLPPAGGDPGPAYGIACGPDLVGVIVGAGERPRHVNELRRLLPLLASVFANERAVAHAAAQASMARRAAEHAEALASALDMVRGQLQRALAEAERRRREIEIANEQLQDQAIELETQAAELMAQRETLQEANDELDRARRAAVDANSAKSEFLATMSHELRTPLNAIGGHLQLIQLGIYGPVTPEQQTALLRIDRNQRHLLGLINDVLNFARIEARRLEYHIDTLCVEELVADLAPMIEPQIRAKGQHFEVYLPDRSLRVRGDREKLQQILLNLLSNSVKFTEAGGRITLECAAGDCSSISVTLTVRDTGIGIPADKLSSIFEPFVQVDARHSREGQGTGLGLAISRDLARGMGGELTVDSTMGAGSSFQLVLVRG
jgi:Signal transduction histidine kinase